MCERCEQMEARVRELEPYKDRLSSSQDETFKAMARARSAEESLLMLEIRVRELSIYRLYCLHCPGCNAVSDIADCAPMDEDGCCIECGTDCSIDGLVAYLKDLESERDGLKAEVEKLDCDAEALEYETLASQAYAARLREALPKVATAMKVLRTMCDVAGLKAGTQAAEDILEEVEAALAAKDQELKATLERVGNWRVLGEPIESALSKNAAPVNLAFTLQYLEDHSMPVTLSADLVNELYIAFAKKGAADE